MKDSKDKNTKKRWLPTIYFSVAVIWYAMAVMKFVSTKEFSECTMYICVGAFFLCLGAAKLYNDKEKNEKT